MAGAKMVMPTDDAKIFRLERPAVTALQAKLARLGHFEGTINGLYGPSTRQALATFQTSSGLEGSGLPTLATMSALLGLGTEEVKGYSACGDRSLGRRVPGTADRHRAMSEAVGGTVTGDPAPPKSLMEMTMPSLESENEHSRAMRGLCSLVAGFQLALARAGTDPGRIDGFPDSERMIGSLRDYQKRERLPPNGELDLRTALSLFGLDGAAIGREVGMSFDLHASPVASDRALMEKSGRRFRAKPVRNPKQDG